ncbi:MAG: rhomboid family intramembrane serine protease [Cytophagaceae bacterium]|nr:rhomboid family intramembrane serine protease [Cytophagaceae bacterium]
MTVVSSDYLVLHSYASGKFIPTQFVSYMFLHGDFHHIFSNMFGLIIFAPLLEKFLGYKKFLWMYFISGIGAGILYWLVGAWELHLMYQDLLAYINNPNPDALVAYFDQHDHLTYINNLRYFENFAHHPNDPQIISETIKSIKESYDASAARGMVGASGAVFGVLATFALLFPNTELFLLFIPFPIKAKYLVSAYGLYELYKLIQDRPDDNVAHFAHLSGMLFAFILVTYWKRQRNSFY